MGAGMDILWTQSLMVGIKFMDDQHHHLVTLINGFGKAMLEGRGRRELFALFGELAEYVHMHFTAEESLMKQADYSGAEIHIQQHREFTGQLAEFILEFNEGQRMLSPEVHRYLRDWLVGHIMDHTSIADRKFASFLIEAGFR